MFDSDVFSEMLNPKDAEPGQVPVDTVNHKRRQRNAEVKVIRQNPRNMSFGCNESRTLLCDEGRFTFPSVAQSHIPECVDLET